MRFKETRPGRDMCQQCYVREAKNGNTPCARMRGMRLGDLGPAESFAPSTLQAMGRCAALQ